jgi:hypothetical protein
MINILEDRNLTSYTYNEETVNEVIGKIRDTTMEF